MNIAFDFKNLALLSIVLTWIGLLFVVYKWPGNSSMTFSLYFAKTKASYIFSLIYFSITLFLFYVFMTAWFNHAFVMPNYFPFLITVACIAQFIPIVIPHTKGLTAKTHFFFAFVTGITLISLTIILALTQDISLVGRIIASVAALYMFCSFFLFLFVRRLLSYSLYFEGIYILSFHLAILAATYIK